MRLFLILLFATPFFVSAQPPSPIDGDWRGSIQIDGNELGISLTFMSADGIVDGSINIPQQNAFNLPIDVTLLNADSLKFEFQTGTGTAEFSAPITRENPPAINGTFTQSGASFPFSIERNDRVRSNNGSELQENEISIELDGHTLTGNLVSPASNAKSTLVIFASGSGSRDRNSSVAGFEIFKKLAELLSDHGYHSFRFDDRGVGKSTGDVDATLHELGDDLVGIANYFINDHDSTFDHILLLGHSQGGVTSSIAAQNLSLSGLVLMASPTMPGDQIINQQVQKISEEQGVPDDIVEQNLEFQTRLYEVVREGSGWEEIEKDLEERLRAQIDELPEVQREALGDMNDFIQSQIDRQLEGSKSRWFKSFIEVDPGSFIADLDIPVLAIYGEKDSQVLPSPNITALRELNRPYGTEIIEIQEVNHLFQTANSGMPGEYGMLDREFNEEFQQALIDWLNSLVGVAD